MNRQIIIITIVGLVIVAGAFIYNRFYKTPLTNTTSNKNTQSEEEGGLTDELNPLSIEYMRKQEYPGSEIVIEQTLPPESNYFRYIASYKSDGLKIYSLLTVPNRENPPAGGWPVIIFNHGYIPPEQYRTTERYIAYTDAFSRNGYMVFKPDYRGHGNSEGNPEGAYYSPAYAIDVLNAVSSIKKYPEADKNRIGMWGHSMGGNITLRDITVDTKDIKAAVIWGGVVGSYNDLMNNWQRKVRYQPSQKELALRNNYRQKLIDEFGTPAANPVFWQSIDPTYHLSRITTPIQLQTGGSDEEVPIIFSEGLKDKLEHLGKTVEYYSYPQDNHNISENLDKALQRSVAFFDKYLK